MLKRELQEALTAARLAAEFVMKEYLSFVPIPDAPASISTHVDHGAQEIILKYLREQFPDDGLIAEERTATLSAAPASSPRTWIVDPIDGTRGFVMKNGEFSIMIGMAINGSSTLGVVLDPTRDRVTYALRGEGCWLQVGTQAPERCSTSRNPNPDDLTLVVTRQSPNKVSRMMQTLKPARTVETFSAGLKLAMVARGEGDAYVNSYVGFNDWDVCAGQILVEEAGGTVSLFDGRPVIYGPVQANRLGFIATNGPLHSELLTRVNRPVS